MMTMSVSVIASASEAIQNRLVRLNGVVAALLALTA
jgi:hypothetical protein